MKYPAILKVLLAGLLMTSFIACEKTPEPIVETTDQVTIMLDVDNVSLESVNIRVRHEGAADMLWVYMLTSDLQTSAQQLLEEKIAADLQLTGEIVVYTGQNKSIYLSGLQPKSSYRFICASLDPVSGEALGEVSELQFKTRRDPAVFEVNSNWSIEVGDRSINNTDKMEYDNFICSSSDDEPYVMLPIKKSDFEYYYKNDIRALFEDYLADFGLAVGDSQWKNIVMTGDNTCSEQRLRSGEWIIFMIGIDQSGELTGLYQQLSRIIEQETATPEYNRWIGTWTVSDKNGVELFDIEIIPSENNMWYYMGGWESTNIYQFDTYDPALMPELFFDKESGKLCFISQYLNTMVTDMDSIDFYFSGTFIYGNTYVLGSEVLNYRMAETIFLDTVNYNSARIEGCNFNTQGMSFPIESICYIYYNGSQLSSISLAAPTLPLTLTKKVTE
jgi:hypothetical protein